MAYTDTKAAIVVHAAAAGAALSDPILDVRAALPVPKGRCIRVYYGGETAPAKMGEEFTLTSQMVGEVTLIAAFFPISVNDEAVTAQIDVDLYTLKHELRTRILGDSQLGGASTDLELEHVEPDLVAYNNTRFLMGLWRVVSDFIEYTIAQ